MYHIFTYLDNKHNTEMIFDPSVPYIEERKFEKQDWSNTFILLE